MRRAPIVVAVVLLGTPLLAGCAADEPEATGLPEGVSVVVDQRRTQRLSGDVLVRVRAETSADLVVSAMTLTSSRADPVTWTGTETVRAGFERDIDVASPRGRCGGSPDFVVELVYRLGDGPQRVSRTPVEDRYGAVTRLLDADCVRTTVEERVTVETGTPTSDGAVLRLPVRLVPAPGADPADGITLLGYGDTTLFRQAPGSARDVRVGTAPVEADLVVEPARCDPHAVAEDKVGTLFGVEVTGAGLPDGSVYTLPLEQAQRATFFAFVREACGLG